MDKIGNASLDVTVGLRSVRVWMDYSLDISEEDTAKLLALEGRLKSLRESASDIESEKDEIFNEVSADVTGRMEDWLALEGEAADAYVQRSKEADDESLKTVEDAYEKAEGDEDGEVSAEDVEYAKLSVDMLDTLFALKRLQASCKQQIASKTVYEDVTFPRAKECHSISEFSLFMPTVDEALDGIVECLKALDEKYVHGGFPLVLEIKITLGIVQPDTPEECQELLKRLDDMLKENVNFGGTMRTYLVDDPDNSVEAWASLEVDESI